MIAMISPAKNMKIVEYSELPKSEPVMLHKAELLQRELQKMQPWDLETTMKVNEKIALQTFLDIQNYENAPSGAAALSYNGLVYQNLGAGEMTKEELRFLNDHCRILSGFYGILKPLDQIRPYRLEMGCRPKEKGKTLYRFWGKDLYEELYQKGDLVVNLASEEYAKTIRRYRRPEDPFLDVEFLTMRNGKLKTIVAWAKMARGQMVRYIVKNRIETPESLKEFRWDGYQFEPSLSHGEKYVFTKS